MYNYVSSLLDIKKQHKMTRCKNISDVPRMPPECSLGKGDRKAALHALPHATRFRLHQACNINIVVVVKGCGFEVDAEHGDSQRANVELDTHARGSSFSNSAKSSTRATATRSTAAIATWWPR